MKNLLAFALFLLPFSFFGQESISFYFENNKSTLNQVELAKLNKWIAANKKSKILCHSCIKQLKETLKDI